MSQFFKSKNSQNKYFIYFLIKKEKDSDIIDFNKNEYNFIQTKIIITKHFILHDLNYIFNNYDSIINNQNYKIIEHNILKYYFDEELYKGYDFPKYPYDIFVLNRILLHSFNYIMDNNKYIKDILFKEKINIVSNINYLKRIKDWNLNWKKNRYSIEKYQSSSENNSESIFSIHNLSLYYFHIEQYENNIFKCKPMLFENKSFFERTLERPNTDYIEKCNQYFDDDKQIKFI
jgi:hypothetical protein